MIRGRAGWVGAMVAAGCVVVMAAGCGGKTGSTSTRRFTDEQLKARFAWDLGAETADVSGYPAAMQKNYTTFMSLCGKCHTTARPLNAPIVTRAQWTRFVHRMHAKGQSRLLTKVSAKAIVDFLVYDASIRKLGRRDAFLNEVERLQVMYADLEVERARVRLEEGAKAARDPGYVSP